MFFGGLRGSLRSTKLFEKYRPNIARRTDHTRANLQGTRRKINRIPALYNRSHQVMNLLQLTFSRNGAQSNVTHLDSLKVEKETFGQSIPISRNTPQLTTTPTGTMVNEIKFSHNRKQNNGHRSALNSRKENW